MAGSGKRLTQQRLAKESSVPLATVNSWATGTSLPRDLDRLHAIGAVLARWAGEEPPAVREWERRLRTDQSGRDVPRGGSGKGVLMGRLVAELTDPLVLEVHRPVIVDSAGADLPVLPPYIRRGHDADLGRGSRVGGWRAKRDGGAGRLLVDRQDPGLLGGGPSAAAGLAAVASVRPNPAGGRAGGTSIPLLGPLPTGSQNRTPGNARNADGRPLAPTIHGGPI